MKTQTEITNWLNNEFGIDKWQFTAEKIEGKESIVNYNLKLLDYPNEVIQGNMGCNSIKEAELYALKNAYFHAWQFNAKMKIEPEEEEDYVPF